MLFFSVIGTIQIWDDDDDGDDKQITNKKLTIITLIDSTLLPFTIYKSWWPWLNHTYLTTPGL